MTTRVADDFVDRTRCIGCDQGAADGVALRRVNRLGVRGIWACSNCLPQIWRCFHCDAVFVDANKAEEHFGRSPIAEPACLIDISKFREMEVLREQYCAEDTDLHRQIQRMSADHEIALRRAEEAGYARGLRDARIGEEAA